MCTVYTVGEWPEGYNQVPDEESPVSLSSCRQCYHDRRRAGEFHIEDDK